MSFAVFQSYSHQDWKPVGPFTSSRLQSFVEVVQNRLGIDDHRREISWLRDAEGVIRYSDDIEETVSDAIAACSIGLIALSKSYIASESCTKEFDLLAASGKPVFLVQLEPVSGVIEQYDWVERYNNAQKALVCRLFEEPQGLTGRTKLIGFPTPLVDQEHAKRFSDYALHLAEDIDLKVTMLSAERTEAEGKAPISCEVAKKCDVLLLATCPELETNEAASKLVDLLEQRKLRIQTLSEGSITEEGLRRAISATNVTAQILGIMSGRRVAGVPLAEMQNMAARADGKPPEAWLTPSARNLSHLHDDYREFIQSIETDTRSLEEFAQSIVQRVENLREQTALITKHEIPTGNAVVVIDAHQEDWETGQRFQRRVEEAARNMLENVVVKFVKDGKESYREIKTLLGAAKIHAVLMMYGPSSAGLTRFESRMPEYVRGVALQRQHKYAFLSALAIGDPCQPNVPPSPGGFAGGKEIYRLLLESEAADSDRTRAFVEHLCAIARDVVPADEQASAE